MKAPGPLLHAVYLLAASVSPPSSVLYLVFYKIFFKRLCFFSKKRLKITFLGKKERSDCYIFVRDDGSIKNSRE